MLAQARIKTITIHTRKETIAILQELKNKINAAYQTESPPSLAALLTLIKIIFYLSPLPKFMQEINTIGTLPLSAFLQNLLIKSRMIRWQFCKVFQSWVAAVLYKMQECVPTCDLKEMKVLRQIQFCELNYEWEIQQIASFTQSSLQQSIRLNDFGLLASTVIFIRNFLVYCDQNLIQTIEVDWSSIVASLAKGSWILNNIVREQNSICINYYLCLKNSHLCRVAIDNGIVNYLLHLLNNKHIFQSLGKKIIQFLTYLLFYGQEGGAKQMDVASIQQAVSRFISKYNGAQIALQVKNLMSILDKKCRINHEEKLQRIQNLFQSQKSTQEEQQITKQLTIVSLYAQSPNMSDLLVKSHQKFHRFLALSQNENILKTIIEILSFAYRSGRLDWNSAQKIITKIDKIISNKNSKDKLNADRKRILIDLVKIVKNIVENRQFKDNTIQHIKKTGLQGKFWSYSDCSNYQYEKQLIELGSQLGKQPSLETQRNIFVKLQQDFIRKAKVSLNRATPQTCQQVKLLDEILAKSIDSLSSIEVSPQLSPILCNYIHTSNQSPSNLLLGLQQQEQRQLRKKLNLICCKFIMKLLLFKEECKVEREKLMELAASADQSEELPLFIHHFFKNHHIPPTLGTKTTYKNEQESPQLRLKNLVRQYFRDEQKDTNFVCELCIEEIEIVLNEMGEYESEQNIIKTAKLLLQLGKVQVSCLQIFNKFGTNISLMYNYLLTNYKETHKQSILLLQLLLTQFARMSLNLFYNDHYLDYNYWMDILMTMDTYFEVVLTKKRILLAQLIFQYLDLNKSLSMDNITFMMDKHPRKELLRLQIFLNKGETLGYCMGSLLVSNGVHYMQGIALQQKQNIIYLLKESGQVNIAKFVALFYSNCVDLLFGEYQLEEWTEVIVSLLEHEINLKIIVNRTQPATLKLRKINQYLQVIYLLNTRKELKVKKNLLFAQEDVLIQCFKNILQIVQNFQAEQFKRYFLQQLTARILVTLANLYRNNFRCMKIKCGDLIQYFQYLLSMSSEQIKDAVCGLMRLLLIKKEGRMMECHTYNACKMYKESLPPLSKQEILYCQTIEEILQQGGSLQQQEDAYFAHTPNNRQAMPLVEHVHIATTSAYLIYDQSINGQKIQARQLSQPLFKEFASETSFPHSPSFKEQSQRGSSKQQEDFNQKSILINFTDEPSISQTLQPKIGSVQIVKNKAQVSEPLQNEFDGSTKIIQQLQNCWTQQQLYEQIQLYLQNGKSVKQIIDNLIPISNKKYYNLLIQLFLKVKNSYSPNNDPSGVPSPLILKKIVQCIPKQYCELDDQFYQILGSGVEGAMLGAKAKNIGLKGLEIYCKRFMNSLKMDQTSAYAHLLGQKKSFQELKYLKTCKIYEVVNEKVLFFIDSKYPITGLCTLINETCRYPPLCNAYELIQPLCNYVVLKSIEPSLRKDVLTTIDNLCRYSDRNKAKIQNVQFLSELVEILQKTDTGELNVVAQLLFFGLEESPQIAQLYQKLTLQEIILLLLRRKIQNSEQDYSLFINLLKILETLATLPQSAQRILKRGFMGLCKPITAYSIKQSQFDLVGCIINTLRNMIQEMELNFNKIFNQLQKDGFLQYLLFIGPFLGRSHQVENYLNIYCKLIPNSVTGKKILEKLQTMLQVLSELARDQLLTQVLIQTWMKLVFLLVQSNRYGLIMQILKSNIFFSAAACLKSFTTLSDKIISMNNRMMREVVSKDSIKAVLTVHGYADFLVQILKMDNLQLEDFLKMLTTLSQLSKSRIFNSKLCTELFAVVIRKLQFGWKEEMAMGSILLLKSIKRKVQVTTEFGQNMLDFFGKFLTQSSKVTSPQYYSISREVICLLSYFLIFNDEIRFLFRTGLVLDILKNWLRISKALAYNEMPQAYKLLYHSIYNSQNLYLDLCEVNSKRLVEAQAIFERGWKCNLYRINGSYKEAILKIDKLKKEIICFKYPDGIIKDKYRISLKELLIIQTYLNDKDPLFLEGNFTRTSNIFQHRAVATNCITLLGLHEANYEVRQISIEALNAQDLQEIYENTTLLVSKWHEQMIEEQSRAWQLINKKEL